MPVNVDARILTRKQIELGCRIEEDEDCVFLMCKDALVGRYSAMGVTVDTLRTEADNYLNGIQFGRS